MRPSPSPDSTMLINTDEVDVAVVSKTQDAMNGTEDTIMALFLPIESASSPPNREDIVDANAQTVPEIDKYSLLPHCS